MRHNALTWEVLVDEAMIRLAMLTSHKSPCLLETCDERRKLRHMGWQGLADQRLAHALAAPHLQSSMSQCLPTRGSIYLGQQKCLFVLCDKVLYVSKAAIACIRQVQLVCHGGGAM